jgi:Tfp pilus assembly protein PilX
MNRSRRSAAPRMQAGATLLISMIFLMVITLIVVSSIKAVNVNTKLVGNMQTQKEAGAAAQQAIESTISADFTSLPTPSTSVIDINNSGQAGSAYTVVVPAPLCTGVKPIKLSELDATNTDDQPCYASGASQNTGIVGSGASGNSLCSNSNWEVNATAKLPAHTDEEPERTPTVHQGIAVRVAVGAAC